MNIQLRHGRMPEAGQGDFWILCCDLHKEGNSEDRPSVNLCIKHQFGGGAYEKVILQFDHGDARVVVTEDEYADMVNDLLQHEDWPSDAAASDSLSDRYATDEYCKAVRGYNPLKKAEEMRKRWEAIKLLVAPHIDH